MLRFFIIIFIIAPLSVFSQNLIKNPGFEDYYFLPDYNYRQDTFYCKDWAIPNKSSVDYFNSNCNYERSRIPLSIFGKTQPFKGEAYIGFIPITWDGYMEQITGTLITPMQKDSIYIISLYLRFAGNLCQLCSKKLEIKLTSEKDLYSVYNESWYNEMFKERKRFY